MKAVIYLSFALMQLSFNTCSLQYKCWLWDTPCLTASAQAQVATLAAGIPQIGIEPLDTMVLDGLHIDQGGFKIDWSTIFVQGLAKSIIDEFSIDVYSKQIRLVFHSDLYIKSYYIIPKGYSLISIPIEGEGEVRMEFDNVQMEIVMPFEITKDILGRDIIDVKGFQYWHEMQGARMYFDNLYNGNIFLSKRTHLLLNENWKPLTKKYDPFLFDKSNEKIVNAIRTYLHSTPLDSFCLY